MKARKTAPIPAPKKQQASRKLSYKEQIELDQLPSKIKALEAEQAQLNASLSDPAFYQSNNAEVSQMVDRLKVIEEELQQTYRRWEELEE